MAPSDSLECFAHDQTAFYSKEEKKYFEFMRANSEKGPLCGGEVSWDLF